MLGNQLTTVEKQIVLSYHTNDLEKRYAKTIRKLASRE